jgi:hypothetical protein
VEDSNRRHHARKCGRKHRIYSMKRCTRSMASSSPSQASKNEKH